MKKTLLLLLLLIVPFILVGCGDKEDDDTPKKTKNVKVIECNVEKSSNSITVGVYTRVEFNEKKLQVEKAYAEYTYDYSSQSESFKKQYEQKDICLAFNNNSSFTSCSAKFENDKAIIHADLNTEQLKVSQDTEKVTAESFAESLEKSLGGECTVK